VLRPFCFACKISRMKTVRILNQSRSVVLCENCGVANNIFTRVRGLLGRSTLDEGEGLLIVPCPSIHMFGMKFSIDVLFLTRGNIVTDFVESIESGKYYLAQSHHGKAHGALEIPIGTIARTSTQRGDQLIIE
jgi:uncharacterized membrane protein (UPF0127 family)